jgi:hypothetical protein
MLLMLHLAVYKLLLLSLRSTHRALGSTVHVQHSHSRVSSVLVHRPAWAHAGAWCTSQIAELLIHRETALHEVPCLTPCAR